MNCEARRGGRGSNHIGYCCGAKARAKTASTKNPATRDGHLARLQMLVDEGREENEFLRGQVERSRHEVEMLRARVLRAAAGGPICSRCAEEIPASASPTQAPPSPPGSSQEMRPAP